MRRRLPRSSQTPITLIEQIEALLALGGRVSIEGTPPSYEVTVYDQWPRPDGLTNHSHHGGVTLAEAMSRAFKAWVPPEKRSTAR